MTLAAAPSAPVDHAGHLLAAVAFMAVSLLVVAAVEHRRQLAGRLRAPRSVQLLRVVAGAGAASAGIHLAVVPSHWAAAPVYGAFFVVAGASQLAYSLLVLLRPLRGLVVVNALGNLALVLLWLQTRTVGVPLGPDQGVREPFGLLDLLSAGCELLVVVAGGALLRGGARPHTVSEGMGVPHVVGAGARP